MLIMAFLSSSLLTERYLAVVNSLAVPHHQQDKKGCVCYSKMPLLFLLVCSTLPSARQELLVLLQQDASAFTFVSFLYAAQVCTVLFSHLCAILWLLTVSGDITPLAPAFCADLLHRLRLS